MSFWSRIHSFLSKGYGSLPGSPQRAGQALAPLLRGCRAGSLAGLLLVAAPVAADLPDVIDRVKPSIVVVGTYQLTRSPQFVMRGTGFVVGDGRHVATNSHVLPDKINEAAGERLVIMARPAGSSLQRREATSVAVDHAHDLALLRVDGPSMPALTVHDSARVREGQAVAFTGFPIGAVLGLSPVTHRGHHCVDHTDRSAQRERPQSQCQSHCPLAEWQLRHFPARRHGLSRQQRRPSLRGEPWRSGRDHQHGLRQGEQGIDAEQTFRDQLCHSL
jgi:S1-C subfamily serine protease